MKQWAERARVSDTEIDGGDGFDSILSKGIVDVGKAWVCASALSSLAGGEHVTDLGC